MKKIFILCLICLVLCGCRDNQPSEAVPSDPPTELTTTIQNEIESPATSEATVTSDITTITVYVPNSNADGFVTVEISGERLSALEALIQAGVLPENIVVNSYSWSEDTLTVDFGSEFRDLINRQGTAGEYILMGSIVNTLITLNNVKYVQVTVDGEILESGHVIYDFPMEFYE